MTDDASGAGHPLFAAIYDPVVAPFERRIERHRRWLAADIDGTVLDIGVGTGAMFPDLADSDAVEVIGVEPDPHMRTRAVERARRCGLSATIHPTGAESLPLADDSVDVVVAALVFCTIPAFDAALDEVARVLKPGGEFRFLEHVRADGLQARLQTTVQPVWGHLAAGCQLDRATDERFLADERFETVAFERIGAGVPPVAPIVRGRLVRRDEAGADDGPDGGHRGRIRSLFERRPALPLSVVASKE
ncbi:class I SAM-dependent methyltransferase [Haloarchaeobius iranensis]|uniref:Methyltransferase domain-containing protein n=1 Tax=Haloarchaeobius iranensis TaxID=996166 RepID=A0A1G9UII5_9EURY|nr:Methyltransferase domain-containing protein [Haloarchaeobius iranensis]